MGTYTNKAAVEFEFKDISFDTNTAVTSSNVNEFIAQEEALLDAELSAVYIVPITASASLPIIKNLATLRVKARLLDILYVKTGNPDVDQGSGAEGIRTHVKEILDRINSQALPLPGAVLVEATGGVKSYTSTNGLTHTFQRDVDQW